MLATLIFNQTLSAIDSESEYDIEHDGKEVAINYEVICNATMSCANSIIHCSLSKPSGKCLINCQESKYCSNTIIFGNECDSLTINNSVRTMLPIENITVNFHATSSLTLYTSGLLNSTIIQDNKVRTLNNRKLDEKQLPSTTRIVCVSNNEHIFINNVFIVSNEIEIVCDNFDQVLFDQNSTYLSNSQVTHISNSRFKLGKYHISSHGFESTIKTVCYTFIYP